MYIPIRISTIKAQIPLNFPIFIFFKEQYVKYIDADKNIEEAILRKLIAQRVAGFFILNTDEPQYHKYLDKILEEDLDDESLPIEDKVARVEGVVSTAVDKLGADPSSKEAYQQTEKAAHHLRDIITKNPDSLKALFQQKSNQNELLVKHSLNVAALSCRLAAISNLAEDEMTNLTMAGLLHDIGITQLPEEQQVLFNSQKDDFSSEDKLNYRTHPLLAQVALEKNPLANESVCNLILSHEETSAGNGYPHKKSKLSLSEEILSLVNSYDKRVTCYSLSPKDALKELSIDELGNYDLKLIEKLKKLLKDDGLLE